MVVTSLAAQLKQLEAPQTFLLVHRTKKASFLFNEKEAANFDRETIYELGLSGLEELKKLNKQFAVFENTLFDISSKTFERSVQTAEVNKQLNSQIKELLILLSPYFLLKPVHKVLEWLINRFHIHQFNIDEILFLGLPYHETMTFARLLQLIPLSNDKGKWNWLAPVKKSAMPLSKTALLNRAATDTAFLKFVCDMPVDAIKVCGSKAGALSTLFNFYCSTVVGCLESAEVINDLHVSLILPSVMTALSSDLIDFTSSAYIILARLSTKIKLADKVVSSIYNKLSKVKGDKLKRETALLFIVLSQSSECTLPKSAVLRLTASTHLIPSISFWSSQRLITLPLITTILSACLQSIAESSLDSLVIDKLKAFVDQLLSLNFEDEEATAIFKVLVNEWKGVEQTWFQEVFSKLQASSPHAFDAASSEALSDATKSTALRTLLGMTSSRSSVFDSLVHPNPDMRVDALKLIKSSYKPEQVGWLIETVLTKLDDDSPQVVAAALNCKPALISADRERLSSLLQRCLIKCWSVASHKVNLSIAFSTLLKYPPVNMALLDLILFPVIVTNSSLINKRKLPDTESVLINVIKRKMSEGMDEKAAFWLCVNEGVLPNYSLVSDHMKDLCELHLVFKFLSVILLAKEPLAFKSSFLSEYLSSKSLVICEIHELIDGKTLKQCLNVCNEEHLPLQPALNFLVKSTRNSHETSATVDARKRGCYDISSESYQQVLGVFSILVNGYSVKVKKMRMIFKDSTKKFLEENFADNEERLYFLLNCAIWSSDKDANLSVCCIDLLANLLLQKKPSVLLTENCSNDETDNAGLLSSVLKLTSPFVPMLASLLHSTNSTLRAKVLNIFLNLIESFNHVTGFRIFVEQMVTNAEELKLDPEQIIVLCYTQLSPNKEIQSLLSSDVRPHMKNALNGFISLITDPATPVYVTARILELLECVNSSALLIKLLPLATSFIGKDLVLDDTKSKVVKLILKKFDDTQVGSFMNEDVWTAFDIILSDFSTSILEDENETTCPSAYLINLLSALLFDNLPNPRKQLQQRFLTSLITKTYECENVKVAKAVSSFFKKVSVEGEIIVSLLKWFSNAVSPVKNDSGNKKMRKSLSNIPSLELLETPEWKKGVFLLEQIQSKNTFTDCTILIPCLFEILKKCLLFELQAPVEYTKQLILSVLLQCCQSIGVSPISPALIQVDLIVQCLRVSQNPQTHHHTLLTLTTIANILPDNVLHSIMDIFTFIGTSIARQDDAYSFQIISKLVETIVPILVKGKDNEVYGVIRVFVAAMLDIPEHRRQVLLLKLINTLGSTEHLWLFLAHVFESHVLKHVSTQTKSPDGESGGKSKKLDIASQLCSEFDVEILLESSARLLELANTLPHDKDETFNEIVPVEISDIFNVKVNSGKQLRHFKYTLLGFLSSLLSSEFFIQQIAGMSDEETSDLEDKLRRIMELCLCYVRELTIHQEKVLSSPSDQPVSRYWKVMINLAYDVLDKVVGILPLSSFVSVVCSLLKDSQGCCPRKVVELVTWRLGQGRPASVSLLKPLLEPLVDISLSDSTDPLTRQTALIALKLLTRHLAPTYTQDFIMVLEKLTNVLCEDNLPWEVVGSLLLCLGELVSSLGPHSICQLARFMPALLNTLKNINLSNGELFLLSCVTCLHKIVDTLSNFLSPYMKKIVYRMCYITANLTSSEASDKAAPIISRLKSIRSKLASSVDGRVLVPAVSDCFSKALKLNELTSVSPLMALLAESFLTGAKSTPELSALFLKGLAFRSEATDPSAVDLVEPHILSALTALVLKLSESAFRPLYNKIYDWAIRTSHDPHRAITFYRLSSDLAEKLRGLFVLFAGLFISNCATLLNSHNTVKESNMSTSVEDSLLLVESIIKTLLSVFTNDSHNFLTKERFNLLMQPLVDQLENELGGIDARNERNEKLLIPCLASMAGATGDDSLWKQLNYQILLKMRHSHPQVKLAALETVHQIAKKLGEDFLPLLPETVPFLAELLEDADETIEKQTHRAIAAMEAVLGEPIQKYF